MASTIKLKNGSGAPLASDLVQGEPALDLTNKRLYTEDSGGNVIEVGTNPSALAIAGTDVTATATELNVLDGITATTTELNYTDGVTSAIQTQLDAKAPIDGATFTGTTTIPTADINGGTIDGVVIGGASAGAGTFTTITGSDDLNIDSGTLFVDASQNNVGIGTSSPVSDALLDVRIAADGTSGIFRSAGSSSSLRVNHSSNLVELASGSSDAIVVSPAGTEAMRIDSSGNVGIGSTSPTTELEISSFKPRITLTDTDTALSDGEESAEIQFYQSDSSGAGVSSSIAALGYGSSGFHTLAFRARDNTEIMRLDGSGYVGINETAPNVRLHVRDTGTEVLDVDRTGSYGLSMRILRTGVSTVTGFGLVAADVLGLYLTPSNTLYYGFGTGRFYPAIDNSLDIGSATFRFDDVYATNGSIQTSDRNEKQDIEELSEAEQRVAVAAKSLMRKFRWKDAVAKKGDDARIHFGIIAQDLKAAFEAEGLDAGRYAMFTHSEWWEAEVDVPAVEEQVDSEGAVIKEAKEAHTRTQRFDTEEEAPEGAVKKDRMGVRYSELLAFIIAAI